MKHFKISFCTVSMNRLHHLKETLPKNIEDNEDYPEIEFVILDYNSEDGLEEYMRENMNNYIQEGRIVYYKTYTPQYFDRSHSRNQCFKLATGDIICNVDADNYMGKGFAFFINNHFLNNPNIFMTAMGSRNSKRDLIGRVCIKKNVFFQLGGFDERMSCYGFEDTDMVFRLEQHGLEKKIIDNDLFLKSIQHDTFQRVQNEYTLRNLHSCYIKYLSTSKSVLVFLLNKNECRMGTVVNSRAKNASIPYQQTDQIHFLENFLLEENWQHGSWRIDGDVIELIIENNSYQLCKENDTIYRSKDEHAIYHKIVDKSLIQEVIMLYSQITNRSIMLNNISKKATVLNGGKFGKGTVYKNFDSTPLFI